MKTFRLIGMALLAVVMCMNFTSCSDDEEEQEKLTELKVLGYCKVQKVTLKIVTTKTLGMKVIQICKKPN